MILGDIFRAAVISECQRFRYWLTRRWDDGPVLLYVMLNPSTADAAVDDATIRRCMSLASSNGYGALEVVNLFAFRATDPKDMRLAAWPIGPENDEHIERAARNCDAVCAAWGAVGDRGPANDRVQVVAPLLRQAGRKIQCLRVTRSGYPQHPLYLPASSRLRPFDAAAIEETMTQALRGEA